jgi:hypothetical protein
MNSTPRCALLLVFIFISPGSLAWGKTARVGLLSVQGETAKAPDELPSGNLFSAEELSNNFGPHQFTPFGDSKFSFEILVPKGWESHLSEVDPDQLAHDTQGPVPMADFAPGGADDVGIQVFYMRVPGQVALDRFMDDYAKNNNGTIALRQKLDIKGRALQDVLMRTTDDSLGPIVNRVACFRTGDLVFIFTGWGVPEKYEQQKRAIGAVLASFNPTGK